MSERLKHKERIVVTGMGAVSPVGLDVEESWRAIIQGKSGIGLVEPEAERDSRVWIAGQVKNFDPLKYFTQKELKRVHRATQFSYAAIVEALTDAGLLDGLTLINVEPERIGLKIGSGVGGSCYVREVQDVIRDKGDAKISPYSILHMLIERTASVPSMKLGIKGPVSSSVAACATGSTTIIDALYALRMGDADVMVAGGAEAAINRVGLGCFASMFALSLRNSSPAEASRPFDKDADGFVMAEGAGIVVLERLDFALSRGAHIRAEIIGYDNTADAYQDTAPSGDGAIRAMNNALKKAGIKPGQVDYINAHGTSTPAGDAKELEAIERVFGQRRDLFISSTKSAVGHMLGAAGGFEAIMCIKAIEEGIIPPTLNLHNPIRDGMNLVPLECIKGRVEIALSNSFGFGGINSVLVFRKRG